MSTSGRSRFLIIITAALHGTLGRRSRREGGRNISCVETNDVTRETKRRSIIEP